MDPALCTIVSNNYLPFARVLARSFREHHPDGKVWVLLVDRPDPEIDYGAQPFEVLFASDLGIPNFYNFAFRYSILELNTAVKPYLLQHLHEREGCEAICYFDPDILVTGDLSPLYAALGDSDLLLTPHVLEPIEDHHIPSERDFLLSGIFNLGFLGIAFNDRTRRLLTWWQDRLYHFCEHRVERGLFVDQKWMDFAPAFVERTRILRDPGYNVAYWNLMHRSLAPAPEGGWTVNGLPLRFFHFSGLAWDEADQVSKYQNRFRLRDRPDLEPIFELYRERLRDEGIATESRRPYGFARFDNGAPVPSVARHLVQLLDRDGNRWANPFATGNRRSFFEWLREPVRLAGRIRVPRLALVMWDLRPDLQRAFPSPLGRDALELARWFAVEVAHRPDLDDRFRRAVAVPPEPAQPRPAPAPSEPAEPAVEDERIMGRILGGHWTPDRRLSRSMVQWLAADVGGKRPWTEMPRLAVHAWHERDDLRAMFPEPFGADRKPYLRWFLTYGRVEHGFPPALAAALARRSSPATRLYALAWWWRRGRRLSRRTRPDPETSPASQPGLLLSDGTPPDAAEAEADPGVTVIGWARARTGVGEACRGTLEALGRAELPYNLWSLKHPVEEADAEEGETSRQILHPIGLYHVNADMMAWVHQQLPLFCRTDLYRIGYWFWELSYFPLKFADSFQYVDEVWAPTRFCQRAFETISTVPVRWCPPAVRPPVLGDLGRSDLDLPRNGFLFLFIFDALSVPERKNPMGLIDAFERVLEDTDQDVHLVIKVGHARQEPSVMEALYRRCRGLPVSLVRRSLTRMELSSLIGMSNAYVSLHRSEGLGLPLMEAMYLGKPVIATGYGGCTDFVDESTAWPVRYRLTRLDESHAPYPQGAVWADPDPGHAARQMLSVLHEPDEVARRSAHAKRTIEETYSPQAAGRRFREQILRIRQSLGSPPTP